MKEKKKDFGVEQSEETKPERRYLVFESGFLKCKIARGSLDPIQSRLEKLRDDRKPKESPEEYGTEVIIKKLEFDRKKAHEKRHVLATLKTGELDDVVEEMVEKLFAEIKFDPHKGQKKINEE